MGKKSNSILFGGLITAVMGVAACGGPPQPKVLRPDSVVAELPCRGTPEWYLKDGVQDSVIFGYGTATAEDRGTAEGMAGMLAKVDLAGQYQVYVERVGNLLSQETGMSRNDLIQTFTAINLRGVGTRRRQSVCTKGDKFTVYMAAGMPIGAVADSLLSVMERSQQREDLERTKTYQDLRGQLDWYRENRDSLGK